MLKVKSVRVSKELSDKTALKIVVSEGRKRHLRRLLRAAGHPVVDLRRIRIGSMLLGDLKEGSYRVIDKKTAYALTSADT
jgi:23S rRNA pseudouridine2605 synthase